MSQFRLLLTTHILCSFSILFMNSFNQFIWHMVDISICTIILIGAIFINLKPWYPSQCSIIKNIIILTILTFADDKIIQLPLIRFNYILLGIFLSIIMQFNENQITVQIVKRNLFYSFYTTVILAIQGDSYLDIQFLKNLLQFSILLVPYVMALIYFLSKIKITLKKKIIEQLEEKNDLDLEINLQNQKRSKSIQVLENSEIFSTPLKNEKRNQQNLGQQKESRKYQSSINIQRIKSDKEILHSSAQTQRLYSISQEQNNYGELLTPINPEIKNYNFQRSKFQREFQSQFYKIIFKQLQDGIILIGEQQSVKLINNNLMDIMHTWDKNQTLIKLLQLENCTNEFDDEIQFKQLLAGLNHKLSFVANNSDSEDDENNFHDFSNIHLDLKYSSQSSTVGSEYLKALNAANQKISERDIQWNNSFQDIKQMDSPTNQQLQSCYQINLLCKIGNLNENLPKEDLDYQGEINDKPSTQNKLLGINIRSYFQENQPLVLIIVKDITLFNQFTVLKQLNQNQTKMISQVAHEFRTPLNCITLLSDTVMEEYKTDTHLCQKFIEPIMTSSYQLLNLVNDLLDLAQIKAGKFTIVNVEFNIKDLIQNVQKQLQPQATVRNLYLYTKYDKEIPQLIRSDPNRIRQIIMNLVSNSLKFTIIGGIIINLSVERQNFLSISVQDTGIGINLENQSRLFKAFGKIEGTQHLNSQGVGLGLMISHILAQKLSQSQKDQQSSGLIAYSEGKNKGSKFQFLIFDHNSINQLPIEKKQNERKRRSTEFNLYNFQLRTQMEPNQKKVTYYLIFMIKKQNTFINEKQLQSQFKFDINKNLIVEKKQEYQIAQNIKNFQLDPISIQIYDEDSEDFSPKDLSFINNSSKNSQYQFKQCECKEILIIDDEPFNILALTAALSKYDLKIASAMNYKETIQFLEKQKLQKCCLWVRIILIDIEIPGHDGYQITNEIRKIEQELQYEIQNFKKSIIVGCSGHNNILQKCIKAGMNDSYGKPVKIMKILNLIDSVKNTNHQQQQ